MAKKTKTKKKDKPQPKAFTPKPGLKIRSNPISSNKKSRNQLDEDEIVIIFKD